MGGKQEEINTDLEADKRFAEKERWKDALVYVLVIHQRFKTDLNKTR